MPARTDVGRSRQTVACGLEPQWMNVDVTETGSAQVVTITASATVNTFGAWTQLIASTSGDTGQVCVSTAGMNTAAAAVNCIVELGTGAAASEVPFVSFICGSHAPSSSVTNTPGIPIPFWIPSGTRIAARLKSSVVSRAGNISIICRRAIPGVRYPRHLDSLGQGATSNGTNMPTNNTYVQVTASTTRAYAGAIIVCAGASTAMTTAVSKTTLGVGPAASEIDVTTVYANVNSSSEQYGIMRGEIHRAQPCHIPTGSRLAVKTATGAAWRDASLIMIPYC